MSIGDDIKGAFSKSDNGLIQLILINAFLFLLANIFNLFGDFTRYFAMPCSLSELLVKPWTAITYMFYHEDFFHILFNMLWLYWVGRIFVEFLGSQRFVAVYLVGGICGGLLYLIIGSLLHWNLSHFLLLGASGSVMAIVIATAIYLPNYSLHLMFFGSVPLKYIALISFVLTSLIDLNINTGGKIAHIGGAVFGYIFTFNYKNGKDITKPFAHLLERIRNFFFKVA